MSSPVFAPVIAGISPAQWLAEAPAIVPPGYGLYGAPAQAAAQKIRARAFATPGKSIFQSIDDLLNPKIGSTGGGGFLGISSGFAALGSIFELVMWRLLFAAIGVIPIFLGIKFINQGFEKTSTGKEAKTAVTAATAASAAA